MEESPKVIDKIKVRPTHLAQSCPVCNGHGTVKYGSLTCHGCEGKGWILIPAEEVKK